MVRRFGPTRAAGVRIEEQDGDKTITPGALGWAGMAGIAEKGPPNKMVLCSTKTEYIKWFGNITTDGLMTDCAYDFFDLANGAGGLAVVRVTDGNELQASYTVFNRRTGSAQGPVGVIKALNGGRWGGKEKRHAGTMLNIGSLTNTTLQVEAAFSSTFRTDELKGGYIALSNVANKLYPIVGNTSAGLITVASDQTMLTDYNVLGGSVFGYQVTLENDGKAISIQLGDGDEQPDTEFSLEVFLDGASAKRWGNLSTDPAAARYWVNVINNDTDNSYISVTDLWTGSQTASVRPANYYGLVASATALVLTATIHNFLINSPTGGNPTFTLGTTTDVMEDQTITVTMSSPTAGTAVSDRFGTLGAVTLGTPFVSPNKFTPGFTITAGATPLVAANTLVITYKPFKPNKLAGGFLYPDRVNFKRDKFRIVANDRSTITVAAGTDLTTMATGGDEFMVTAPIEMRGGRGGHASHVDANYQAVWEPSTSPFNDTEGQNLGLIKFATTGIKLGREARIVSDFDGYHKAQAGVDAVLPRLLTIPTLDKKLNEELLNPVGINVIKKSRGNYVLWGDRNVHIDPQWKFKHQREQMSYYEHVLQENFDFIIFSINDKTSDREAETSLNAFFLPEFAKRALRGTDFKDACVIKVDEEVNTDATRANGDKIAVVSLQLADTTERFIIRIGKQGIFESVA